MLFERVSRSSPYLVMVADMVMWRAALGVSIYGFLFLASGLILSRSLGDSSLAKKATISYESDILLSGERKYLI